MKNNLWYLLILLLMVSCSFNKLPVNIIESDCELNFETSFNIDSIIADTKQELNNESIKKYFSNDISAIVETLENTKVNSNLLWPYSKVDSAHFYRYKPFDGDFSKHDLDDRELIKIVSLCEKKIDAMLKLMNNPTNFMFGECGTPIPEAEMKFYYKGKVVGEIRFACTLSMTFSSPANKLSKFGVLNEKGNEILDAIAPWK